MAATAPSFDSAYKVTTISGEFVVKTPTISPVLISRACSKAANRSTTESLLVSCQNLRGKDREILTFFQLVV